MSFLLDSPLPRRTRSPDRSHSGRRKGTWPRRQGPLEEGRILCFCWWLHAGAQLSVSCRQHLPHPGTDLQQIRGRQKSLSTGQTSPRFTLYSPCILLLVKSFITPTYALYSLYHVIRPYICFGLLKAILRGSKYFNIDYTSVFKSWYIHLRVKQNKTLVPDGFNYTLLGNLLHWRLKFHSCI